MRELNLGRADLRDAKLQHAIFVGASLCGAHLEGTDLTDVDFSRADITSCHFKDITTNLKKAILIRTNFHKATFHPLDQHLKKEFKERGAIISD